jgi:tektin-4
MLPYQGLIAVDLFRQSTEESWEHFTKTTLDDCENCRQQSIAIRSTLNAILMNVSRDLRSQHNVVDQALSQRIARMEEIRQRLENELTACLRRLADTEIQIEKLKLAIQNMDHAMKLAQTRMDNRNQRPRIENCRDFTQNGLIFEIDSIHNGVTDMLAELKQCEEVKSHLIRCRGDLEREIMHKRRTILIDRERCQLIRSHYPSATNLTGY